MVITYHGGQSFKITFGETTLAFDPVSKSSKLPSVKFGADVAFISMRHENMNGTEQVAHGAKEPFVADGPGAYEIGSVVARGFGVKTSYEGKDRFNTIYQVQLEGMNIVFLGALGSPDIDAGILESLGDIDILFVPIGGGDVLSAPQASKLGVKLEARVIIPMHYDKKALDAFLKEESAESVKPVPKLTLKKKDIAACEGEIAVLAT